MFYTAFYSVSGRFYAHSYKIASLLRPIEALSLCLCLCLLPAAYCALPLLVHSAMQLSALHCLPACASSPISISLFLFLSCLLIHCVPLALWANERARELPALTYTTENLLRRFYFHFHTLLTSHASSYLNSHPIYEAYIFQSTRFFLLVSSVAFVVVVVVVVLFLH